MQPSHEVGNKNAFPRLSAPVLFDFTIFASLSVSLPTSVCLFCRINTHLFVCSERVWRHGV